MNCFRYKIEHDWGFAPNPFHGTLTLATCKGDIRGCKELRQGDFVIGFGSKTMGNLGKMIYAMRVDEILTFDQYYVDPRYQCKKPIKNGSLVQMYGDNVYHTDTSKNAERKFIQDHCAHSHDDWSFYQEHYDRDTRCDRVLLSKTFYYFGDQCIDIPDEFSDIRLSDTDMRGNMKYTDLEGQDAIIMAFIEWLAANYEPGIHGDPCNWKEYNLPKLDIYED